jgi:hypothetical protein
MALGEILFDDFKLRFIGNMLYLGQKRVCDGVVAPLRR